MPKVQWIPISKHQKIEQTYRCLSPKPGKPIFLYALASEPKITRIHWLKRSLPHLTDAECPYCKSGLPLRTKGYLPAVTARGLEPFVFEFTDHACTTLKIFIESNQPLRGRRIIASRESAKPNSKILLEFKELIANPNLLPRAFDIEPTLMNLWGLSAYSVDRLAEQS